MSDKKSEENNKEEPETIYSEPRFLRGDVATILNVSTLTIANREDQGKYPKPKRDLNNYRIYTLNDIFNLQQITFGSIDSRPIVSLLYDKGYRDVKALSKMIDDAITRRSS